MKIFNKVTVLTMLVFLGFGFTSPTTLLADDNLTSVDLGAAGNFVILAKTGISTTGATSIVGDIGISPAAATFITGFDLTLPAVSAFSTSALITGKVYAPGYADPTPSNVTTAISDMQTAYTDAAGRASNVTELGAGNIGGLTLAPGVYKWGTGVTIPTDVTLSGSANDVWIFQIAQNLSVSSGAKIILSGGAQIGNIFWVVGGQTTLGTTSVFNGNILDQTAIVLNTGAILNGRALAQTAVTLDANSVTVAPVVVVVPIPLADENGVPINSSPTANVAQSTTPLTFTNSLGNTITTMSTGCSGENKYNTSTGQLCVNNNTNQSSVVHSGSYNFGTVTLKNGSKGDAVMELQRFLNVKLNLGLVVDGKLGPKTITVVKKWQKDNGLVVDGLIGAKTKAQMNASVQ